MENEIRNMTSNLSRRTVLQSGVALSVLSATGLPQLAGAQDAVAPASFSTSLDIGFTVNGEAVSMAIDPRTSVLDLLREEIGLTGAKKGCDHGQCGACTIHIDGKRVVACLTPAFQVEGRELTTIEGIAAEDELHPMQQAFIDNDALQCGYCTPGQIMSGIACVREGHAGSDDEIREYMSGNLCRCGAYPGIVAAIAQAAQEMET
ncbi:(2Fe-2S)-binding protein [Arenibacterium sp. LLYu02]|uniref:(2Fe-2S)-binding protein n=1 Tax=Arenibacterium sp. LLYu02 TaxID=3404132 RepID=UPI003B2117DC